jgi:hypothetical protein
MKFQEIQKIAKGMGIKTYRMKKVDLVRTIQRQEENIDCYGTQRVENCQEPACLWRGDCRTLNNGHR